jgi:hypothetical protein
VDELNDELELGITLDVLFYLSCFSLKINQRSINI